MFKWTIVYTSHMFFQPHLVESDKYSRGYLEKAGIQKKMQNETFFGNFDRF